MDSPYIKPHLVLLTQERRRGNSKIATKIVSKRGVRLVGQIHSKVNERGTISRMERIFFVYQLLIGAIKGSGNERRNKKRAGSKRVGINRFIRIEMSGYCPVFNKMKGTVVSMTAMLSDTICENIFFT